MAETLPANYYMSAAPRVTDWSGVVDFMPSVYQRPGSLTELENVLAAALRDGLKVRVMGGQHSCADLLRSTMVIDTSALPLEFDVAPLPDGGRAVASAWMHVHEFNERAARQGLSLTSLGGTDAQRLAGLLATDTAGATIRASIYETLAWVELMTVAADGKSIELRRIERGGGPDFEAVVASLGVLGVMTRMAFDLVPQRFFFGGAALKPLTEILGDLDQTNAAYDFWRIEWLPANDDVGNFWFAKATGLLGDPDGDYPDDRILGMLAGIMRFDHDTFKAGPLLTPVLKAAYDQLVPLDQPVTASGPLRNMIPVDRLAPIRVAMSEIAIRPQDLSAVMACCRSYFQAKGYPNLSTEIQCSRTETFLLSPWNWPDVGAGYIVKLNFQYITDFLSHEQKMAMLAHLGGLWSALTAAGIRFKAHWGKLNFFNKDQISAQYPVDSFKPMIQPMFVNDYLAAMLPI